MRIIAGEHRGRRIQGPADETTRPITDRVKTALFDRLAAAYVIEDAVVLDLFSGTGSMGLECLSRGAGRVLFVDRDREAVKRLKENLAMLRLEDRAEVVMGDALLPGMLTRGGRDGFTLVFVDPPYRMVEDEKTAKAVYEQVEAIAELSSEGATLVLRTPKHVAARELVKWLHQDTRAYGAMSLHLFGRV